MIMKRLPLVTLVFLLTVFSPLCYPNDLILNNTQTNVFFSPKGGCTEAIVNEINNSQSEVPVLTYSFTSAPAAKASVEVHKRRAKVQAILDKNWFPCVEWVLETLKQRYVDCADVVTRLQLRENDKFLYKDSEGALSIGKGGLDEFHRLTGDSVVWDAKEKYWRRRSCGRSPCDPCRIRGTTPQPVTVPNILETAGPPHDFG